MSPEASKNDAWSFDQTDVLDTAGVRRFWKPLSASTVIALISAMMICVLAGFLNVARQQEELAQLRFEARQSRMARQALADVDTVALRLLTDSGGKPDLVAFGKAVSQLEAFGPDAFPATVMREPNEVPSRVALASLRSGWDDMVAHLDVGEPEAALAAYKVGQVERDMNAFASAFAQRLDGFQARYAKVETSIGFTIWACLIGQIVMGLFAIGAFLFAARRGARASRARAVAVSRADATREQVVKLFEMTDMLQSANDLADANAVLKAAAADLLANFGGALYVFSNSHDRLTLSTHWGMGENIDLAETIGLQQCWALKRGKPHVNGPSAARLCCDHHDRSYDALEIPMIARGETLGLLQVYAQGEDAQARLAAADSIATAVADSMSLALANLGLRDKLRSQALRDPLTNLYNRRYMEDTLQRVVRLAERDKSEVSLIMIDLDHFKRLNDSYGHAKGDAVLREVAALIVSNLRDSDVACRYGGEELLIILPHCGLEMAALKAERLRAGVEALSEPGGAQITASFGVAAIPTTSTSVSDMMSASDAALYRAKQEGRNRVARAPISSAESAFRIELDAAE